MADPSPDVSPCVACGYRDSIDGDFCGPCRERRAVEDYLEADAPVINRRQKGWGAWTSSPDSARERQRRSRLIRNTRPKEPATAFDDPLELADRALESLQRVRQALRSNVVGRQHLDDACELIRQLGWGPQSENSRLQKPAGPVFDLTTPAGRMKKNMHRRWHTGPQARPCNCR